MPPTHGLGCCSNCGNSGWGQQPAAPAPQTAPAPAPVLRVTSSLSLEEPGPKTICFPLPALHLWGCCSAPRDRQPGFAPPAPQRRAFHPHILCVTVACDAGTALPPARLPPPRFPMGSAPSPGMATLEQNWSRAVHRQLSHIPNRFGQLSRSPAAIPGSCCADIQSVAISVSTRPWKHRHSAATGKLHSAPGKTHLGS